ncbi:MAG: N-acetyltransferase family protein [Victivallaceae bacterium]|nr:N-acetyltransferase family protein [Victivallaceae bacterium]
MNIEFEPLGAGHRSAVMRIFNYYVENSFSAFPERALPEPFFEIIIQKIQGYPAYAAKDDGTVAGFCFLSPYSPMDAFRETAAITYFIAPEYTARGIGGLALSKLIDDAREIGIRNILAEISSKNEASLAFHRKHGFKHCGTLAGVGKKHGQPFDMVFMQKVIS